jgi:Tripartite tricarboxylate transporter TctB family
MSRPGVLLLVIITVLTSAIWLATPMLIQPFPTKAPWYESAASFPRAALILAALAGCIELFLRTKSNKNTAHNSGSDELDSSNANLNIALAALALFCAYALAVPTLGFLVSTLIFLTACGLLLRLPVLQILLIAIPLALALWFVFVKILKVAFGHGWLM